MTADIENVFEKEEVSHKIKALLKIAAKVQQSGAAVTGDDICHAKENNASDKEIHDTVLIAAAFCMFNRYVDGLNTVSSTDKNDYTEMGQMLATRGYTQEEFA